MYSGSSARFTLPRSGSVGTRSFFLDSSTNLVRYYLVTGRIVLNRRSAASNGKRRSNHDGAYDRIFLLSLWCAASSEGRHGR